MRLYLAYSHAANKTLEKVRPKYVLASYLETLKDDKIMPLLKRMGCKLLIDSGAYSFQEAGFKGDQLKRLDDWDAYLDSYIAFLIKHQADVEYYVELDIDKVLGVKKIKEYRKRMHDAGLDPIVVWHPPRGFKAWKQHCKDYSYVGFNTLNDLVKLDDIRTFMYYADKYDVKVHGFGTTKPYLMENFNFYSVDSLTWLAGGMYGHFFLFDGQSIKNVAPKRFAEVYGKAFNKIHHTQRDYFNLLQWKAYAEHLEQRQYKKQVSKSKERR